MIWGSDSLMQPAPPGWSEDFRGHFQGDEKAPNDTDPGLLRRIFGVERPPTHPIPQDADQFHRQREIFRDRVFL